MLNLTLLKWADLFNSSDMVREVLQNDDFFLLPLLLTLRSSFFSRKSEGLSNEVEKKFLTANFLVSANLFLLAMKAEAVLVNLSDSVSLSDKI